MHLWQAGWLTGVKPGYLIMPEDGSLLREPFLELEMPLRNAI